MQKKEIEAIAFAIASAADFKPLSVQAKPHPLIAEEHYLQRLNGRLPLPCLLFELNRKGIWFVKPNRRFPLESKGTKLSRRLREKGEGDRKAECWNRPDGGLTIVVQSGNRSS